MVVATKVAIADVTKVAIADVTKVAIAAATKAAVIKVAMCKPQNHLVVAAVIAAVIKVVTRAVVMAAVTVDVTMVDVIYHTKNLNLCPTAETIQMDLWRMISKRLTSSFIRFNEF